MKKDELIYADLTYSIIGCAFKVFNEIGPGLYEKDYQKALTITLREKGLAFKEQVAHDIRFGEKKIGYGYFDFVVEDKVVLELKRGKLHFTNELYQTLRYLKMSNYKLGMIIRFTPDGVTYRRVLNIDPKQ